MFIIGAGVAGLAAIGAAVSLGAQVRAFDVRPEVGEQIESMGATFVQAAAAQQQVSADGYAQKLTEDQEAATARMYAEESAKADIVITTALVRGWAPTTITADMVANMKPGSVIVDLAAVGGGNCESTVPGEKIVTDNGVTIIGYTDLTSRMPAHTAQLYGTNIVNLLKLLTPGKDGQLDPGHGRRGAAGDHASPTTVRCSGRRHRCRCRPPRRRSRRQRRSRTRRPRRNWPSRPGAGSSASTPGSASPRCWWGWRSPSRPAVSWGTSRCSSWRCSSGST